MALDLIELVWKKIYLNRNFVPLPYHSAVERDGVIYLVGGYLKRLNNKPEINNNNYKNDEFRSPISSPRMLQTKDDLVSGESAIMTMLNTRSCFDLSFGWADLDKIGELIHDSVKKSEAKAVDYLQIQHKILCQKQKDIEEKIVREHEIFERLKEFCFGVVILFSDIALGKKSI